jgi:S-DNA-T family DNA segregation ATPase FtsK/SpoIIIE
MRHLLIAGTTGSGKSVMTNNLIMSLLYRNSPSDMRLIIVDPKRVEMAVYKDVPHLLTPIINDTGKALSAMKWAAGEMDRRYTVMEEEGVKTIYDYNEKMAQKTDAETKDKMPYIVIVIDEMSDLMMQASKELEPLIVRIAQLGRAAGMHLVLATQKPVVKVITGLIKGNIPSRIAFRVLSSMDSRIILDSSGADKLLGQGDMLLSSEQTSNGPERIQGAWTPDSDIKKVTDFLRAQRPPQYNEEVIAQQVALKGMSGADDAGEFSRRYDPQDPLVRKAVEICINNGKFSTSLLRAHLGKGHGYVAGLGYWLESINVIGPVNGTKPRDILVTSMDEFDELASS